MTAISARTIRADIEARISSGDLNSGDRLPSVRMLAGELNVAPATVAAAYRELRLRGMVSGRGRQGTRVAPARRVAPTVHAELPDGLIDAMYGSPDPEHLPPLGPALEFAASLPQPRYGGPLIAPLLADAARSRFAADGVDATNLAVTSGAMDAVERVLSAFDLRIGDRIGVEDPGHIPVHQIARSAGLELVPLPVDEHGITPTGLEAALTKGLAAIVATPRAHNPTGAAFTAERAQTLTNLLARHPATALIQDDHAGLVAGVDYHPLAPPGQRWATMRSLGKSFGPDVRVALVVGDEQTIHRVSVGLSNGPGWVSFILQRAAAFLLAGPGHHRVAGRNRRQLCPATESTHRCARRLRRASQRCVGSQCVDTNVAGAASNRCCPQRRVCHPVRDSVSDRAKTSRTSDHYQSQRRPHCRDRQSDWHLTSLTTLRSVDVTVYRCNGLSMQRSTAPSSRCRRVRELRSQAPRCQPRHRSTHCRRVQRSHHPGSRRQPPRHSQPYCSSRLVGRCR